MGPCVHDTIMTLLQQWILTMFWGWEGKVLWLAGLEQADLGLCILECWGESTNYHLQSHRNLRAQKGTGSTALLRLSFSS